MDFSLDKHHIAWLEFRQKWLVEGDTAKARQLSPTRTFLHAIDLVHVLAKNHVTVARTNRATCFIATGTDCLCGHFGQRRNNRRHIRVFRPQTKNCDRRPEGFDSDVG